MLDLWDQIGVAVVFLAAAVRAWPRRSPEAVRARLERLPDNELRWLTEDDAPVIDRVRRPAEYDLSAVFGLVALGALVWTDDVVALLLALIVLLLPATLVGSGLLVWRIAQLPDRVRQGDRIAAGDFLAPWQRVMPVTLAVASVLVAFGDRSERGLALAGLGLVTSVVLLVVRRALFALRFASQSGHDAFVRDVLRANVLRREVVAPVAFVALLIFTWPDEWPSLLALGLLAVQLLITVIQDWRGPEQYMQRRWPEHVVRIDLPRASLPRKTLPRWWRAPE